MVNEQNILFRRILKITDISLVASSFFIGYFFRNQMNDTYWLGFLGAIVHEKAELLNPISFYIGYLPVLLLVWWVLLGRFGMYKSSLTKPVFEVLGITFKTALAGFIVFGGYIFMLRLHEDVSRLYIGIVFVIASVMIITEKAVLSFVFRSISKKNTSFKSVLISFRSILVIGTGKRAEEFLDLINSHPEWGIRVIGLVDRDVKRTGTMIKNQEVLGSFSDIPDIIHRSVVDEVVFVIPRSWLGEIEEIMHFCESEGIKVNLAVDLFDLNFTKAKQTNLDGFPLLTFESTPDKLGHMFVKRLFDFIISSVALLMLSPIFLLIAAIIKVTSDGPVFFKQARSSLYGRQFQFYKFRTMIVDAESKLKDLMQYNEMSGPVFKMTNDPRVTRIGKWLRKLSLDELPQLWNVCKGDMSLVGPRPPLPSEVEKYTPWQRRRLSMRPGITCMWQISGRNEITDFNEWMQLDLKYIDSWSLWLDFKILF
ncbi:sugar transferase, partial [bacterium]|nr:sugar transferase [bacterium]